MRSFFLFLCHQDYLTKLRKRGNLRSSYLIEEEEEARLSYFFGFFSAFAHLQAEDGRAFFSFSSSCRNVTADKTGNNLSINDGIAPGRTGSAFSTIRCIVCIRGACGATWGA
jgi:hypothetical protein